MPQWYPLAGRLLGLGERRADHAGVGAAGDRLGQVAAVAHAAVGDDVDVPPGLEQVLHPGAGRVGDRRRLGHADADHLAGGAGGARADADEHADRAGAHEVEGRRVRRAPADDDRDGQLGDEALEVERLVARRDVLSRDDGALDDEDVEAGVEGDVDVLGDLLRGERAGDDDALLLDVADALADELRVDGLAVDLLQSPCRLGRRVARRSARARRPAPRSAPGCLRGSARRDRRSCR